MINVPKFCGLPSNGSYVVYVNSDKTFGRCFLWTTFSYISHLLFAVVCAYRLGVSKRFSSRRRSYLAVATSAVALLSALSLLIEVILSYSLHDPQQHPPAYVLAKTIAFTSWLMCFLLQWGTNTITKEKKENNKYVLVTFVLVLLSSCMQLQLVVQNISLKGYSAEDIPVDYVGVIVGFTLNILFFLLCVGITLSKAISAGSYNLFEETKGEEDEIIHLGQSETTKNVLSKLVYWWSNRLLQKGFKRQLKEPDDLYSLPSNLETKSMKRIITENLKIEKERLMEDLKADGCEITEKTFVRVSLFKVLNRCFGKIFYSIGVFKFFANVLNLVQPTLVNLLVTLVSDKDEPIIHGYYYALAFLLTTLFSILCDLHYRYNMKKVNLRVRAALITVIYEKTLSVRCSSLNHFSTGKIVNLMSTDTDRVRQFCDNFHECWSVPFQLIVCMYLLYQQVGAAFLPPIIYCVLIIPVATRLSKKVKNNQMKVLGERDKRIKMVCEVLFGIRIIKYNVWEKHFADAINAIRNRELKFSFMIKLLIGGVICIWSMTVSVMLLLSIGTYVLMGYELTAAKVFTVMAVIDRLVNPLNSFSWNMNALIDSWVSLQRIETYLSLPEINLDEYYKNRGASSDGSDVKLEGATFRWNLKEEIKLEKSGSGCSSCCRKTKESTRDSPKNDVLEGTNPFVLKDISIRIGKGQFVGITGKVGSGKSSLFASITAEMEKYDGRVSLSKQLDADGIGFFTQEAWIQHLSIKDNILFGREYDETRYNSVMHACALHDDINLFPAGDLTEVGENGVNLSGGQKARISLARAVYQDKEMYLLDDPIAAVDAHVAKHIYKHCIMGLLKDKTKVLCTHHTTYLRQSDHVIVLKDGEVDVQGPPDEVLKDIDTVDFEEDPNEESGENDKEEGKVEDKEGFENAAKKDKLVEEEEKRVGSVSFKVYKLYWTSFGHAIASFTIAAIVLRQAGKNFQDWWLSHWVTVVESSDNNATAAAYHLTTSYHSHMLQASMSEDSEYYLSVYGYIVLGYLFFVASGAFVHAFGSIRASKALHNLLLGAVMKTPVSFFDVTPVGRIVNRFSTDISDIDGSLPLLLQIFSRQVASLTGSIILICISLPWFTALLVPLGCVYYWIQLVYRRSSRELKRIGSVARSPIYEHFTETLSGYMTIRAFRKSNNFIAANELKLDKSQRAEFNEQLAAMWLTFRLDLIGVIMVTAVSLFAVLEHHYGSTNAGMVGLAITYSIQITPILGYMLTMFTETEKQMVRVERISQYVHETPREIEKSKNVALRWPDSGKIDFHGVYLRYRENLPFALEDVSFEIKSGEKIGVCGRTGSGKSTLLKVLFSIVDITSGRICIDGINIADIDPSILRSRMSIIPQDQFLFDDTVSKNLDPTEQFSSYEMLDVLGKCHLSKLEGKVGEKGNNLSAGQKQLLCLARALLKRSKIICIDEATASVDLETDKLIQVTIREEFAACTVLRIAHRMNTIIDSDRVLIMNAGQILEFAPPEELLADSTSEFYALVNENTSTK